MEAGSVGSNQLVQGPEGLDDVDGRVDLDTPTDELPAHPIRRTSVLADDGPRGDHRPDSAISVHLQTDELPFQQPNPVVAPIEPAVGGWRATIVEVGRWPLVALLAAAVLVAVFAAFITRNGQSPTVDGGEAEPSTGVESASVAAGTDPVAGTPAQAELGSDPSPGGGQSDGSARSTGTLGAGEGADFFSGQVMEPDRSLNGAEMDWTSTTAKPATTSPPSTATTRSTEASSTTAPESTSTVSSTSTTPTTAEPSEPWVRAIGPGSADARNPAVVATGRVTLQAEGSSENMRYRFLVFVRTDDGDWRRIGRSRWRLQPSWTIDVGRYEGRTIRWTVVGVAGLRNGTEESAPLYFQVGEDKPAADDDDDDDDDEGGSEPDGDADGDADGTDD